MDDLVSTEWLAHNLGEPDLVVVDASWFMPGSGRDARAEYRRRATSPARASSTSTSVATRPTRRRTCCRAPRSSARAMAALGVGRDDRIVVYDNSPLRTAARGWFMLRHFGAEQGRDPRRRLAEMAGRGAPGRKRRAGRRAAPVSTPSSARGEVVAKAEILAGVGTAAARRARQRPGSKAASPIRAPASPPATSRARATCRSPRSTSDDGTFEAARRSRSSSRRPASIRTQPFVATCGSGVTANSLIFAAHLLGDRATRLYDGSWSEWGADPATPKEKGPA